MYITPFSEIVNGRPVEHGYAGGIYKELITDLPEEQQDKVFKWIKKYIVPRKTPNRDHNSYGLKHYLEDDTGIYLNNNQFKDAMLMAGFKPVDHTALNWTFCISEKPLTLWRKEHKGF